jgi:hypothetical protein
LESAGGYRRTFARLIGVNRRVLRTQIRVLTRQEQRTGDGHGPQARGAHAPATCDLRPGLSEASPQGPQLDASWGIGFTQECLSSSGA